MLRHGEDSFPVQDREREVLFALVEIYLKTRLPVGSRTLSKRLAHGWSPATLRNIMSDLMENGFLYSPHVSAGRVPTEKALQAYIHHIGLTTGGTKNTALVPGIVNTRVLDSGALALGALVLNDPRALMKNLDALEIPGTENLTHEDLVENLAFLSQCISVVFLPPVDWVVHALDFVLLSPGKALSLLVTQCGQVEHRLISIPEHIQKEDLQQASNYLNARVAGHSLSEAKRILSTTLHHQTTSLHKLCANLLQNELSSHSPKTVIKGQSHAMETVQDMETFQTFKSVLSWLETQKTFQDLFDYVCQARSMQIFLGSEDHPLFKLCGCSFIITPYGEESTGGAVGVIGSLHMDYSRIVPMIHLVAQLMERKIGQ